MKFVSVVVTAVAATAVAQGVVKESMLTTNDATLIIMTIHLVNEINKK